VKKEQPVTLDDAMRAYGRGPDAVAAAIRSMERQEREVRDAGPTPARQKEMDRERAAADAARYAKPERLKPGTKVKVHITGWRYDERPSEVVEDRGHQLVVKRLRGGRDEEVATVNFNSISPWRHQ
jgi:hypothetical protein